MSKITSVTVAIPSMGSIKTFTVASIVHILGTMKIPVYFSLPVHTYIHEARRICVEEARQTGCSHLFFLDSDMLVCGDVIMKLAEHNKMVVGALYNEKKMPPVHTVKVMENGKLEIKNTDNLPRQIFKCYAVATGCMLIDMRVFDKLEKPWFFYNYFEDGRIDYGEDVWFCDRVQKAGFDVWCDPTIDIRHIGDFAY